ncbi:cyclophilin-like domain-containing protein [Suillus ampliporus]|nr:cyclophilin-like domain-containing protein [Suillus ampliporus]
MGDKEQHKLDEAAYFTTRNLLANNAAIYGFPSDPQDLSSEQQEMLREIDKSHVLRFVPPEPLCVGRLVFELNPEASLKKTTTNFTALCTGEKGKCKNARNKELHYLECPIHRIVRDFMAQGGDITRGDGSGGESIYGGKFNDEKDGLKIKMRRGTLAMANSGKNSNSSQFFVVLTDDETQLAKLNGKYVAFGELQAGFEVLDKLNKVAGDVNGKPSVPVWIGGCGKETAS